MTTQPVDAAQYYQDNAAKEQTYLEVYKAEPVKTGDLIFISTGLGIDAQVRVEEEGYLVNDGARRVFLTQKEFNDNYIDTPSTELATAKPDLPADMTLKAVKKGDEILIDTGLGLPALVKIEKDGYQITENGFRYYKSDFDLQAVFNIAGQKPSTPSARIVACSELEMIKGIVLDQPVTFAFKSGNVTAEAGSFLIPNEKDEDGYTVYSREYTLMHLRMPPTLKSQGPGRNCWKPSAK